MDITFDGVVGGYAVFKDKIFKVGVLTTQHHRGLFKDGVALYQSIPRDAWTIHWCSPIMSVDEAAAVVAAVATLPDRKPDELKL